MSYHHLSTSERGSIEALHKIGYSVRKISMEIHRHPSTIARELRRNSCDNGYIADTAELFQQERIPAPGTRCKCTKEIKAQIEAKLDVTWSPEQIAHTVMKEQVCFKTIYR